MRHASDLVPRCRRRRPWCRIVDDIVVHTAVRLRAGRGRLQRCQRADLGHPRRGPGPALHRCAGFLVDSAGRQAEIRRAPPSSASWFVILEKFWLTGILHRRIQCSDPVKSAPGKGISMARTPILFIPLVIVLTTFINAPASAWAATGVRFGVDQSLSGPAEASDPEIREVGLAVSPSNPGTVVAVFSDDFPRSRDINCRWVSSADGGQTWVPGGVTQLLLNGSQCFDESVVADASGTFFLAYLEVLLKNRNSRQNILVARSADGGRSFPAFSIVASSTSSFFVDKPLL